MKTIISIIILFLLNSCLSETRAKDELPEIGSFVDERDQKEYRWIDLDGRIFMAENLNYNLPQSRCYNDEIQNCDTYGHLYDFKTANNIACPSGWRLPNSEEGNFLTDYYHHNTNVDPLLLAEPLKSEENYLGYFGILLGGRIWDDVSYGIGENTHFWVNGSSDYDEYTISFEKVIGSSINFLKDENFYASVRCIKDEFVTFSSNQEMESSSSDLMNSSSSAEPATKGYFGVKLYDGNYYVGYGKSSEELSEALYEKCIADEVCRTGEYIESEYSFLDLDYQTGCIYKYTIERFDKYGGGGSKGFQNYLVTANNINEAMNKCMIMQNILTTSNGICRGASLAACPYQD